MLTIPFETSFGIIPVRGKAEAFGRARLTVLAITGAKADPEDMIRLPVILDPHGYDGLVAALPGNRTPELSITSIEAWGEAFDEVVTRLNRPVVVIGVSVGGLVALAMRRPKAMLVIDPPMATGKLWPMVPALKLAEEPDRVFIENVLGYYPDRIEDRRYLHLLHGLAAPVTAIFGEEPLMPRRPVQRYPSLVDVPERAAMAAHPLIETFVAPGAGHNVPRQASGFVFERLLALCKDADPAVSPFGEA